MAIDSEDLLRDLGRLETSLGRFPTANDVVRDGRYSVNTYYKRFGGQWRAVEQAFDDWTASGESPVEASRFDWRSLQGAAFD